MSTISEDQLINKELVDPLVKTLQKCIAALEPFRKAVYNDNYDLTVSHVYLDYDKTVAGWWAHRKASEALENFQKQTGK